MAVVREKNRRFVVSADQGGIFISPRIWADLYLGSINKLCLDDHFVGTEMYPWIHPLLVERVMEEYSILGVGLEGMHLRTGGIHESYGWRNRAILAGLNQAMVNTPKALSLWGDKFNYMLIHSPEARNEDVKIAMRTTRNTFFYIENHKHTGAYGTSVAVARDGVTSGLNVGVMFDLWHDFESLNHHNDDAKKIQLLVSNLEWVLQQADQNNISGVGLHIPLGLSDCLPEQNRTNILNSVGKLINEPQYSKYVRHIVLENQPLPLDAISMPFWKVRKYARENEEKLRLIKESGLLG